MSSEVEIKDALRLLSYDGSPILIGVLSQNGKMLHRSFASIDDAATFVCEQDRLAETVAGIYTPVQQLKPDAKSNTKDDVAAYTHFFVDVDRKNKKDANGNYQNATHEERTELLTAVQQIVAWVSSILGAIRDQLRPHIWADTTVADLRYDLRIEENGAQHVAHPSSHIFAHALTHASHPPKSGSPPLKT